MRPLKGEPMELYEDYYGDDRDIYEVDDSVVQEFLATGNFEEVDE